MSTEVQSLHKDATQKWRTIGKWTVKWQQGLIRVYTDILYYWAGGGDVGTLRIHYVLPCQLEVTFAVHVPWDVFKAQGQGLGLGFSLGFSQSYLGYCPHSMTVG